MSITFCEVSLIDGDVAHVVPEDEPRIDAAVTAFLDFGGTRDTVLDLTLTNGGAFKVRVSRIASWALSSPELRARSMEIGHALKEEAKTAKEALGWQEWSWE